MPTRPATRLARLDQSARSFASASHVDQHAAQHLRDVDAITVEHKPEGPRLLRVEQPFRGDLVRMLRQPRTVAQAFVLSEVFAPPKGLVDYNSSVMRQ